MLRWIFKNQCKLEYCRFRIWRTLPKGDSKSQFVLIIIEILFGNIRLRLDRLGLKLNRNRTSLWFAFFCFSLLRRFCWKCSGGILYLHFLWCLLNFDACFVLFWCFLLKKFNYLSAIGYWIGCFRRFKIGFFYLCLKIILLGYFILRRFVRIFDFFFKVWFNSELFLVHFSIFRMRIYFFS